MMVRDFQRVIGDECLDADAGADPARQPDAVIACVGGGSNAMGIFYPYIPHRDDAPDRRRGRRARAWTAASTRPRCQRGTPGVLHGNRTYLLQDDERPDHRDALDLAPASTTPASAPSMPT